MVRRPHVLLYPNPEVAAWLREHPGEWFLVATGERERRRVLTQTAFRIRHGLLADFSVGHDGRFEAVASADKSRPDQVADVEVSARFVPSAGGRLRAV